MPYVSTATAQVRSYELDSYGHVNNAVYMQWLEHGRSRLLQDHGLNYNSIEEAWGVRFVTVATKIDFKASLNLEDEVEITTAVTRFGRTSVTFDQRIRRVSEPAEDAALCETTIVFTDPAMAGAVPIPDQFRELYA